MTRALHAMTRGQLPLTCASCLRPHLPAPCQARLARSQRKSFNEDDQEALYMRAHDLKRQGRRGLGKSEKVKIAGVCVCVWGGTYKSIGWGWCTNGGWGRGRVGGVLDGSA